MNALFAIVLAAAPASGVVVAINGPEVVIDLGTEGGLDGAAKVSLYRGIEVKHPRTGRRLRDEFFVATIEVAQVGARLSILRPPPEVLKALAVGDSVRLATEA